MIEHLPDESQRVPAEDIARTRRPAALSLVFAVLLPPVGIVLGVLVLRRAHREPRDHTLAIGALLVAIVVLVGEVVLLIALMTGGSADSTPAAAGSFSAAAPGTPDVKGVVTACRVVMPALGRVRAEAGKVTSADQYGEVLTQVANTIVTGAAATTDPTFLDHVGQLSQAFQKAWQDSSNGTAPSAVADELTTAGEPVSRDCTAAGYHP